MGTSLLDTLTALAEEVTKELENKGLMSLVAEAAQRYTAEIEEVHEGDFLKLTDEDREARAKEMAKYPVGPSIKDTQHKVATRQKDPGYWTNRVASGIPKPIVACCGPGDACSSSTCTGTPITDDHMDAAFGFGQDLAVGPGNSTTVFPSVGLYELINKLTDTQKDGLIESLGEGRWVKLDTLKKAIEKIENPGPRFNQDPLRAQ